MTFSQGLRFTFHYLIVSLLFCSCVGAFLYLSNMTGEPLVQLKMEGDLFLYVFGMEARVPAELLRQLQYRAGQMFYFLPPYGRMLIKGWLLFS